MTRKFDVDIVRRIRAKDLDWPEPGAAGADGEDSGFGGNRCCCDLRRMPWPEARRVYTYETRLVSRICAASDPEEEYDRIEDELCEDVEGLYGLDIGVASSVIALSAARRIPFSSCNGGAFGSGHYERHPLVAFYARPSHADLLLECAEMAECGLEQRPGGHLLLYAGEVQMMLTFAKEMLRRSGEFRKLRLTDFHSPRSAHPNSRRNRAKQLKML